MDLSTNEIKRKNMIATLKTEILYSKFKIGDTIEVESNGFDDVYQEETFKVLGTDFWLPESEIELLSRL